MCRAYSWESSKQRQPAAIAAWLETTYPAIARRARAARAVIYWGDETGISNQDQIGRSYAPKGQTPVIARTAKRVTQSMISAVSNRGLMRFMLYKGALNADQFIAFLRRLIKDAGQKVVLIVDNRKVHKAHKVQAWVKSHGHEIELCYLPSDRKSTRLNSSHANISYAVFCLKKKKKNENHS